MINARTAKITVIVVLVALVALAGKSNGVRGLVLHGGLRADRTEVVAYFANSNGIFSGDDVRIRGFNVGKIDKIGSEEIGGHRLELITISFDENKMTLRVPVAQARVTGLRKLATPEVMAQVMTILSGRPRVSRLMWAKRAQEFQAKINSGDLKAVAEVCRDLQSAANGSAPSYSQRNLFELAIDRLAGEFAGVVGTDKADAIVKLTQKLVDGRTADTARSDRMAEEADAKSAGLAVSVGQAAAVQ